MTIELIWKNIMMAGSKTEEELITEILASDDNFMKDFYIGILNSKQKIYNFGNGYGVSVVKGPGTKGFKQGYWEIILIKDIVQFNNEFPEFDLVGEPFGCLEEDVDKVLKNMSTVTSSLDFDPNYISEDMFY